MVSDLYHWLLLASLKALLILPVVLLAASASRRTSSAVISLMLACALLLIPATPFLDFFPPTWNITLPVLGSTGAFSDDLPDLLEHEEQNPIPIPPAAITFDEQPVITVGTVVLAVWALGGLVFLLARVWRSLNSRLRHSTSRPIVPGDPVLDDFHEICAASDLPRRPWLLYNDSIAGPQSTGLLRLTIHLPASFQELSPDHRRMILLHELAHFQRRDLLWRIILELVSILFWFHPLVWLAMRRYHLESEKACDDAVIHAGHPPSKYGEVLLEWVRANRNSAKGRGTSSPLLRSRMLSVVKGAKNRHPLSTFASIRFAILFTVLVLPLGLVSFTPYPRSPNPQVVKGGSELRALWRMNIGRGSIVPDSSGNERHAKVVGAQWTNDSERGTCLRFDGRDDHLILRAPDATWTGKPFTMCVWLKPAPGSDGGGLLLRGDLNQIWSGAMGTNKGAPEHFGEREIILTSDQFSSNDFNRKAGGLFPALNYFYVAAVRGDHSLHEDKWSHLAITWTPAETTATINMFINGERIGISSLQGIAPNKNNDWPAKVWYFGLGECPTVAGNNYEGLVSGLAIYQKELTPEEIRGIMQGRFSD